MYLMTCIPADNSGASSRPVAFFQPCRSSLDELSGCNSCYVNCPLNFQFFVFHGKQAFLTFSVRIQSICAAERTGVRSCDSATLFAGQRSDAFCSLLLVFLLFRSFDPISHVHSARCAQTCVHSS